MVALAIKQFMILNNYQTPPHTPANDCIYWRPCDYASAAQSDL
jgi:hypothetical protein